MNGRYMNLNMRLELPESKQFPLEKAFAQDLEVKTGDDVLINEADDPEAIGKISSIYFDCLTGKVMLKIQWYFKPQDTKIPQIINSCSKVELFFSDYATDVEIDTINGKVTVLTIEEILGLNNYEDDDDDDVHFSRAKWNYQKKVLEPPMNQWKTDCICNAIINPDIPFKFCNNCERILHVACLDTISHQCPGCGQDL